MVFESIVADLLNKILGDYVVNLDSKQLKIGIWGGDVVLEKLQLKENALDDLDLPVSLIFGYIGKLVLKIPWKNIYSQPVVAQIEDVYALVTTKQSIVYDPVKEAKYELEAKRAILQKLEESKANKSAILSQDPTFAEKLSAQIINNIQIKIENVHLRYEDSTTADNPFSVGVTLHGLEICTTNELWQKSFVSGELRKVFKVANLDSLAIYMNCKSRLFTNFELGEYHNLFFDHIAREGHLPKNYKYIFGPISLYTKLQLNMKPEFDNPPFKIPKVDLVLEVMKLNVSLTKSQFQDLLKVGDAMNRMNLGLPYRKYRPFNKTYKNHYHEWWVFAITCILEEDVRRRKKNWSWNHIMQHRKLLKTYAETYRETCLTKKPSATLKETLNLCEEKLDLFNLVLVRNRVDLEVEKIKFEEKKTASKGGWFSGWWGGGETDENSAGPDIVKQFEAAMSKEEKAKLYDAIGYHESGVPTELPIDYEAIKLHFKLNVLEVGVYEEVSLPHHAGTEVIEQLKSVILLQLLKVSCDISQRPTAEAIKMQLAVNELSVTGYKVENKTPIIVEFKLQEKENLLSVLFETNPLDKSCDQRVKVRTRQLQIIYDAATVLQLLDTLKVETQIDLSSLENAASEKLTDFKSRSATGMQYLIEKHNILDIDIEFLPNIVIIPQNGSYALNESTVIIICLGKLTVKSEPRVKKAVSELHSLGVEREKILDEVMSGAYDQYNIKIADIQLLVARSDENWREVLNESTQSDMHILDPTSLSLSAAVCIIEDDPRLPKTKVEINIPSINIHVTEERIFDALDVVLSIPLPNNEPSQPTLVKTISTTSAMSLMRILEYEQGKMLKRATEKADPTEEAEQFTSLYLEFNMDEFAINIYKSKESLMDTSPDQYKTPLDEEFHDSFGDAECFSIADHEKILSFMVQGLATNVVQRTYDMKVTLSLGAIKFNQYHTVDGAEVVQNIIDTPLYFEDDSMDLLKISYTNANKKSPDFMTKYNSIEQLIIVNFSRLTVTLHQECIMTLLKVADNLQRKINRIKDRLPVRDREANANTGPLISNLSVIREEEDDTQVVAKKATKRKVKVIDSIKIKLQAILDQVSILITCNQRDMANLQIKHFEAGVVMKDSYTEIGLVLKDFLVKDLNPITKHPIILSIIGENALNCRLIMFDLSHTSNYNKDNMKIDVTMGCVKVFFLNWFTSSILTFLNNCQVAQEAITQAGAVAAESAKQNVTSAYEQASRIKLNIKIKAPIIVIPINSHSDKGISLDLGFLSITNTYSELSVPKYENAAIIDDIKLELKEMKLSKVKILHREYVSETSLDRKDYGEKEISDIYGLKSEENIFDPISFTLSVTRSLSSWYKEKPDIEISGRLKSMEINVFPSDYALFMSILEKNLTEGKDEFAQIKLPKMRITSEEPVLEVTSEINKDLSKRRTGVVVTAEGDSKKVREQLKFNFQFDGLIVNLMTGENEGLASFGFYVLSVKGSSLVDGTFSISVVLCDLQLDDIRSATNCKIRKYLQRKRKQKDDKTGSYMLDVVAIIKEGDTFAEVRVCGFDLILSIDFIMKIVEFLTVTTKPTEQASIIASEAASAAYPAKGKQVKKKQDTSESNTKLNVVLHLEQPDIILVESLEREDTTAIIFNSEVLLKYRLISSKQIVYGEVKDLKMYMCAFDPALRESTKHFIINPCTMLLQGSTPDNEGLHINIKLSDVIINISPGTIELLSKATRTLTTSEVKDESSKIEYADYSNIWQVKNFKESDFWFMKIEEAVEAAELLSTSNELEVKKNEACIVEVPMIAIIFETGIGYYTKPILHFELKMNASISNWSSDLKISSNLTAIMSYYNEQLAVWEPIIEPIERLQSNGLTDHSPWELNGEVQIETKKNLNITENEETDEKNESLTKIKIHSPDVLEITLSKTCYDLLLVLGEAFQEAFDTHGLHKPDVISPYILENDTGFEIQIKLIKGPLTLHDCHIPTTTTGARAPKDVTRHVLYFTDNEIPFIDPDEIETCKVSAGGKVYLKRKKQFLSEMSSASLNINREGKTQSEYLHIQIGNINKEITLPISRTDERYFTLYRDTRQEPWGIISTVRSEYGSTKINVHGVVSIKNHFTTTVTIYRQRKEESIEIGKVEPGELYYVPLYAIYSPTKELFFSLPGYKRSVQGIKWDDLPSDMNYNRQLQCDPVNTFEPLFISATREKKEVFFEITSKYTLLSASYTLHLRPPLFLRNALPINIKVSVAGCTANQEAGAVLNGVDAEELRKSGARCTMREDFLDYGEKDISSGDVLHLPTVKLTSKSGEAKSFLVIKLVQYLEKDWSCTTPVSAHHEEYQVWTFTSYDSVVKMDLELGVKFEDRHNSLFLTLYCPIWMINKTGLTLSYRASTESINILYHPPNYEGPVLFSFREKFFFGKKRASIRVESGEWSDKFPLDVAGNVGVVQCQANDMTYHIGVHNHLTYDSLTKRIIFIPFYTLINKAYFELEIQEVNRPADPWTRIPVGSCVPYWPKGDSSHTLLVRVPDDRHISPPFKFTEAQCILLKLKNKYGGVMVDVQVTEGGTFITFTEYHPGDAPGLIINHTDKSISLWEKGNINERILEPNQKLLYSWIYPPGERKLFWDSGKEQIEVDLRRDGVGTFKLGTKDDAEDAFWVSFLDGTQRILLFTQRQDILYQAESSANLGKVNQVIELSLHGIGLSIPNNVKAIDIVYIRISSSGIIWESRKLGKKRYKQMKIAQTDEIELKYQEYLNDLAVNNFNKKYYLEGGKIQVNFDEMKILKSPPREIRRTFYPGVWLQLKTSPTQTQIHAKMNRIQIDNQLVDCIFPVVLAPIPPPKSIAHQTALKPFIEVSIVERLVPHSNVKQYKYFTTLIQEFDIKVDLLFVNALLDVFSKEVTDAESAKLFMLDLKSITTPLQELISAQSQQEQKNYYDNLHLGPLKIHLSFSMAGSSSSSLPPVISTILQGVGVTLTSVNDVVFRLAYFEREYQFLTQHQLMGEITSHYTGQALKQLYVLVFGLDVLGNPFGLVTGLKQGIEDLFYEPIQGAVQGPGEFAEGLVLGVRSLFGHAVGGAAGAVSKITGAMGKGLAALTFDKEYQRKRQQEKNRRPANFHEGIARSGRGLVMGVVDGISGVITKPISGARAEGAEGFFKGLGKGAVGLFARPTAGVVDFASGSFEAVKRVTDTLEEVHKIRPSRVLHIDAPLRPYKRQQALGWRLLREVEKGKYADTDNFEYCEEVVEKREFLLVTNHRVLYLLRNDLFGNFTLQWVYSWSDIAMIRPSPAGLEITLNKEDKKFMGMFSSSEPLKKLIPIPYKARCETLANAMERIRLQH